MGRALARRGLELVYGGGRVGLMGEVSNAVLDAGGEVIGVIPRALLRKEIAYTELTDLRVVETMHARKAHMAELADGFIALPGGLGTLDELFEILTWAQLGLHEKPCGLLNAHGFFDKLIAYVDHTVDQGFVRPAHRAMILIDTDPDHLLDQFAAYQAPRVQKWIDPGTL